MAKIKYRTNVAVVFEEKCNDVFIDSGAVLHFFRNRSDSLTYEYVPIGSVNDSFSISKLIGKGTVQLPIDGSAIVKAYHTLKFSANISSVRILLKKNLRLTSMKMRVKSFPHYQG